MAEPCETLTTPVGYTLTPEGQRVAKCIAGGGLLLLADPSGPQCGALTFLWDLYLVFVCVLPDVLPINPWVRHPSGRAD